MTPPAPVYSGKLDRPGPAAPRTAYIADGTTWAIVRTQRAPCRRHSIQPDEERVGAIVLPRVETLKLQVSSLRTLTQLVAVTRLVHTEWPGSRISQGLVITGNRVGPILPLWSTIRDRVKCLY